MVLKSMGKRLRQASCLSTRTEIGVSEVVTTVTVVEAEEGSKFQDIAEVPPLLAAVIVVTLGQGRTLRVANAEGDRPGRLLGLLTHLIAVAH